MYDERPQRDPPTPQSSCISTKPVGLFINFDIQNDDIQNDALILYCPE